MIAVLDRPQPVVGMRVTWVRPEDDRRNARYLRAMIGTFGTKGMTVAGVHPTNLGHLVNIMKDGELLREGWKGNPQEKPANFQGEVRQWNWWYFRQLVEIAKIVAVAA